MLCRERGPEVNLLLHHHIFHGRRLKDTQHKFLIADGPPGFAPPQPSPSSASGKSEASSGRSADEATALQHS